jgi:hypothetical protein
MKYLTLFSLLLAAPFALAEDGATPAAATTTGTPAKTEETVTLSEEATAPLFERVRGAHLRAQQNGKVAAVTPSSAAPEQQLPQETKK